MTNIGNESLGSHEPFSKFGEAKKLPFGRFARYSPILILFSHPTENELKFSRCEIKGEQELRNRKFSLNFLGVYPRNIFLRKIGKFLWDYLGLKMIALNQFSGQS